MQHACERSDITCCGRQVLPAPAQRRKHSWAALECRGLSDVTLMGADWPQRQSSCQLQPAKQSASPTTGEPAVFGSDLGCPHLGRCSCLEVGDAIASHATLSSTLLVAPVPMQQQCCTENWPTQACCWQQRRARTDNSGRPQPCQHKCSMQPVQNQQLAAVVDMCVPRQPHEVQVCWCRRRHHLRRHHTRSSGDDERRLTDGAERIAACVSAQQRWERCG